MEYYVMTLFPEMIEQGLHISILGRAIDKELIRLHTINIRDFSGNKHNRVDDYPYGGGAGMVMAAPPVVHCYESVKEQILNKKRKQKQETDKHKVKEVDKQDKEEIHKQKIEEVDKQDTEKVNKKDTEYTYVPRVIYLTPQGKTFHQEMAKELAKEEELVFLCGHYEGIDERALEMIVTDYISIGDYVLTGGELPVMVMIDAISRFVSGVLNNENSAEFESFQDNLLEYPQYTRPEIFEGRKVPEILLSGHHAKIEEWRRKQSILRTMKRRPDLMEQAVLNKKEQEFYKEQKLKKEQEKF